MSLVFYYIKEISENTRSHSVIDPLIVMINKLHLFNDKKCVFFASHAHHF